MVLFYGEILIQLVCFQTAWRWFVLECSKLCNAHATKSLYLEEILYQHDNMTSQLLHETLMRIFGAVCDCAVFPQTLISRSSHWVHIQSRWSSSRDEMKRRSKWQSKTFFWWKVITQRHRIHQGSHVKHAFEIIFHWHTTKNWKLHILHALNDSF